MYLPSNSKQQPSVQALEWQLGFADDLSLLYLY